MKQAKAATQHKVYWTLSLLFNLKRHWQLNTFLIPGSDVWTVPTVLRCEKLMWKNLIVEVVSGLAKVSQFQVLKDEGSQPQPSGSDYSLWGRYRPIPSLARTAHREHWEHHGKATWLLPVSTWEWRPWHCMAHMHIFTPYDTLMIPSNRHCKWCKCNMIFLFNSASAVSSLVMIISRSFAGHRSQISKWSRMKRKKHLKHLSHKIQKHPHMYIYIYMHTFLLYTYDIVGSKRQILVFTQAKRNDDKKQCRRLMPSWWVTRLALGRAGRVRRQGRQCSDIRSKYCLGKSWSMLPLNSG